MNGLTLFFLFLAVAGISAAAGYGFNGMIHRELRALIDYCQEFREFVIEQHNRLVEGLQKDDARLRQEARAVVSSIRNAL